MLNFYFFLLRKILSLNFFLLLIKLFKLVEKTFSYLNKFSELWIIKNLDKVLTVNWDLKINIKVIVKKSNLKREKLKKFKKLKIDIKKSFKEIFLVKGSLIYIYEDIINKKKNLINFFLSLN